MKSFLMCDKLIIVGTANNIYDLVYYDDWLVEPVCDYNAIVMLRN